MNYLLFTEFFQESEDKLTGGVEGRCFNQVKYLSNTHTFTIICSRQPGQSKESSVFGAKVIRCGPIVLYSNRGHIIKRLRFAWNAYRCGIKLKEIDIVEGASFLTYLPAYFTGKKLKARKVATWHETWLGEWVRYKSLLTGIFGEVWERIALRLNWDKIISVSDFTKNKIVNKTKNKLLYSKIVVIPNGIKLGQLKSISAVKHKHPSICYFGRINFQKNLDVLIKAVDLMRKEIPDVKCYILGEGPALPSLKELVAKLRLEQNVLFLGRVGDRITFLQQAKQCQLYIHPSTLEGFGITVLEAISLGLPYVITDIEPFVEVTENGQGGFIFAQNDVKDLADKALKLLKNHQLYAQKVKEGQILVEKYDWSSIFTKDYSEC
jgi:glycosyltransferase involved in cell wall biosynthesis